MNGSFEFKRRPTRGSSSIDPALHGAPGSARGAGLPAAAPLRTTAVRPSRPARSRARPASRGRRSSPTRAPCSSRS
ncbi:MAG: hypothetical protein MZW92_67005 [Comamonadaceae bacterium]|nr:hypothetical protein [Comamonadaceae bacterium]